MSLRNMYLRNLLYNNFKRCLPGTSGTKQRLEACYHDIIKHDPIQRSAHYLAEMLSHCSREVPFYQPYLVHSVELNRLPILNKELVIQNRKDLQSKPPAGTYTYQNSSGGSTGAPFQFTQDGVYAAWCDATDWYYYRHFLGLDPERCKKVLLWGSPRDIAKLKSLKARLNNWGTYTTVLDVFMLRPEICNHYIERINQLKPELIKGYAAALYHFARYVREKNCRIHSPKVIYSSADILYPFMRAEIEEVFQTKVHNFYGSREVGAIAGECKSGSMHLFQFNNFLEIIATDSDSNCEFDQVGRVVVSNLHNQTMPLLRYDLGDIAAFSATKCACGSPLPVLSKLEGKILDFLERADGMFVGGAFFTAQLFERADVREFQINQYKIDSLEVLIVPREKFLEEQRQQILKVMADLMGQSCQVEIRQVQEIARTPQGKYRYVRNLIEVKDQQVANQ